jgi:hypothetical protein
VVAFRVWKLLALFLADFLGLSDCEWTESISSSNTTCWTAFADWCCVNQYNLQDDFAELVDFRLFLGYRFLFLQRLMSITRYCIFKGPVLKMTYIFVSEALARQASRSCSSDKFTLVSVATSLSNLVNKLN